MSVFLKIDIPRGQESNYFNRSKYLVYEDRSLYETDFEGNRWLFAYHCHPGYSFLELPVNIKISRCMSILSPPVQEMK